MTTKRSAGAQAQSLAPAIRIAPPGELNAYVVYEHDLERLATGSPSSLYLNFSLSLLSVAITLVVTLATTRISSDRVFYAFLIVCAVTLISGLVLLTLWWRHHESSRELLQRIKNQMPPNPGTQKDEPDPARPREGT